MAGNNMSSRGSGSRPLIAPELLPLLDHLPGFDFNEETLRALRAGTAMAPRQRPPLSPGLAAVACEQHFIPGPPGAPEVRVLVYTPPGPRSAAGYPALLHMHGGGYV